MKNYNTTLTEKQQKYLHYHHVKLIKYLTDKEILLSNKSRVIEQAKFT